MKAEVLRMWRRNSKTEKMLFSRTEAKDSQEKSSQIQRPERKSRRTEKALIKPKIRPLLVPMGVVAHRLFFDPATFRDLPFLAKSQGHKANLAL
jgi:hypothetical protein